MIFFEASNLLELDPPVFRFGMTANVDDCLTPGDGEQREPPQPQTLWDALFSDEKKIQMDKFYQKHYGGVHAHATKMFMVTCSFIPNDLILNISGIRDGKGKGRFERRNGHDFTKVPQVVFTVDECFLIQQ